eukprot:Pgem_evm1s8956
MDKINSFQGKIERSYSSDDISCNFSLSNCYSNNSSTTSLATETSYNSQTPPPTPNSDSEKKTKKTNKCPRKRTKLDESHIQTFNKIFESNPIPDIEE